MSGTPDLDRALEVARVAGLGKGALDRAHGELRAMKELLSGKTMYDAREDGGRYEVESMTEKTYDEANDEANGYPEMAANFARAWPRVRKIGKMAEAEPLKEWLDFQAFQYRLSELRDLLCNDIDGAISYGDLAAALETVRLCVFGELDQREPYQSIRATVRQMKKKHGFDQ